MEYFQSEKLNIYLNIYIEMNEGIIQSTVDIL